MHLAESGGAGLASCWLACANALGIQHIARHAHTDKLLVGRQRYEYDSVALSILIAFVALSRGIIVTASKVRSEQCRSPRFTTVGCSCGHVPAWHIRQRHVKCRVNMTLLMLAMAISHVMAARLVYI